MVFRKSSRRELKTEILKIENEMKDIENCLKSIPDISTLHHEEIEVNRIISYPQN